MTACSAGEPRVIIHPPAECPRPAAPEFPELPQGILLGSVQAAEWLMICIDEVTDYARELNAALACYEHQARAAKKEDNGSDTQHP